MSKSKKDIEYNTNIELKKKDGLLDIVSITGNNQYLLYLHYYPIILSYMINSGYHYYRNFDEYIQKKLQKIPFLKDLKVNKDFYLLAFFLFLFFVVVLRLFWIQVVNHTLYEWLLSKQHVSSSLLKAKRGNIFAYDKSGKPVQLTENITIYNVFVDPKFIWDKPRFLDIITPVVYTHLCEMYGMKQVSKIDCIKNIETYTNKKLLPKTPDFFYYWSGIISTGYWTFDWTGYNQQVADIISGFNQQIAYSLIKAKLDDSIYIGIKKRNYLWFFPDENFLAELKKVSLDYISIEASNYIYIVPSKIISPTREWAPLKKLLTKYGYINQFPNIDNLFREQENRYVKIITDANPMIAQMIKDLKEKYYQERSKEKVPLLHSLWLEPYTRRYYEYWSFLSNVLGMVDKNNTAYYGIEQYFDPILRGKDGKIIWRSSSWIGNVGANDFQIDDVVDGNDVYLTIDIWIQKEIESLVKKYLQSLKADSVSILVYDPINWTIKASATYPTFDPNGFDDVFQLKPLWWDDRYLIDDQTYLDVPVYIYTWWTYRVAKTFEREDISLAKYVSKNIFWPRVFVDKNIAMPYEPGSIFKPFTVSIGLDLDEISLYDFYNDTNEAKVWPYTIKNADPKLCWWYNSFLHALVYSCNVGMVKIANGDGTWQIFGIGKESFYNYLEKLGFGKLTNIELAGEAEWYIEWVTTVALSRFLNNTFWQGLLTTPLQIAAWYAPLLNGWFYLKPTIIKTIFDTKLWSYIEDPKKVLNQIFKPETSESIKYALFNVLDQNKSLKVATVDWYKLGGKSWTSQISYKGKYMQWIWWTNASFVGILTQDDPRYVVIIQVRRPRSSIWWSATAAKIFWEVAKFLINYSLIIK